jgi:hypothetical protein
VRLVLLAHQAALSVVLAALQYCLQHRQAQPQETLLPMVVEAVATMAQVLVMAFLVALVVAHLLHQVQLVLEYQDKVMLAAKVTLRQMLMAVVVEAVRELSV